MFALTRIADASPPYHNDSGVWAQTSCLHAVFTSKSFGSTEMDQKCYASASRLEKVLINLPFTLRQAQEERSQMPKRSRFPVRAELVVARFRLVEQLQGNVSTASERVIRGSRTPAVGLRIPSSTWQPFVAGLGRIQRRFWAEVTL